MNVAGDSDWSEIARYLRKLDTQQIRLLGGELGLDVFNLEKMHNLPGDMVKAWLRKEDNVLGKCGDQLTWGVLVKALQRIGQNGIARDILRNKCSGQSNER